MYNTIILIYTLLVISMVVWGLVRIVTIQHEIDRQLEEEEDDRRW